jgi:hypothetical protein
MRSLFLSALAAVATVLVGCADASDDAAPFAGGEDHFSSNQATLLDFEFDGSLVTDFSFDDKKTIQSQLLYTIGHLNNDNGVGRLDNLVLTNIVKTQQGGQIALAYHAKLPVAWGSKDKLPKSYDFKLPKDVSATAQETFTTAHKDACVDFAAHEVGSNNMWYYYRPQNDGCTIADSEVIKTTAKVTRSTMNTTGKYPEYQKVWEDDRLEVISIFGKYEATGAAGDAGVEGFNDFVRKMKSALGGRNLVTTPANLSDSPAPAVNDVTFETTLADGKHVKVTAFLVDAITSPWEGFDARYESLTPTADLISYSGHAGLGQNVRALARKGKWVAKKYQMFFINGCDSFAYVDGSLAQTRAVLNTDDVSGTKYMEFITNAMPSFFSSMPDASLALINGLLGFNQPKTYEQMFADIDRSEVVLVTGEEDNEFKPGMTIGKAHTN